MVLLKGSVVFKLNLSIIRPEYSALTRAIPDLLMPGFAWTSPAMILVKLDKRVLVVHGKGIYNLCYFRVDKRKKVRRYALFQNMYFLFSLFLFSTQKRKYSYQDDMYGFIMYDLCLLYSQCTHMRQAPMWAYHCTVYGRLFPCPLGIGHRNGQTWYDYNRKWRR